MDASMSDESGLMQMVCVTAAVAVVVVVLAWIVRLGGSGDAETEGPAPQAARWVSPQPVVDAASNATRHKLELALRVANGVASNFQGVSAPMWYDDFEQAYMILLTIGENDIALVFDTGSASLMVKDDRCVHRGQPCPLSKNPYRPSQHAISLHPPDRRLDRTTFGSQTVYSRAYMDVVKMQGRAYGHVKVHSISRIEGTTTSNVMGMAPYVMQASGERKSLADDLFRDKKERAFTIDLIDDFGVVYFSRASTVDPEVRLHRAPIIVPPSFRDFSTRFYTIEFSNIRTDSGRVYDPKTRGSVPRYLMIDTGTTHTYLPREFARTLVAEGWRNGTSSLVFNFPNGSQWCLPASLYNDEVGRSSLIGFGGPRNAFDEAFGNTRAILVGAIAMRRTVWEHDLESMTMGWYQKQEGCMSPPQE